MFYFISSTGMYTYCCVFCVLSDIKENKNLHELLYLVLLAGNFLNAVSILTTITSSRFVFDLLDQ